MGHTNRESPDVEVDVCVIGGGPTALFAALLCARSGRSVVLVASQTEFEPAGTGISPLIAPPTLGLLAAEGVEAELEEAGQRVLGVEDHGGTGVLSAWRYADHDGVDRPYGLTAPTGTLTQALLARLRAEPTASIRTGEAVTGVEQDDDAVVVVTGTRIRARYLVAADGRRSAVRDLVGVAVTESVFDRPAWLTVAPAVPDREPLLFVRHQAPRALFTIPTPRRTIAIVWSPDREGEEALDRGGSAVLAEQVKAVDPELSAWLGEVADRTSPPMRLGFALWRASSWRVGRVLLLGETAHGFHTLGGQGLNQSLQSAASLARAVDDALRPGQAARIDDYERIRRPHVEWLQDVQWQVQALRSYSEAPPERGAHEDFIGVMTTLQPELAAQLEAGRPA